MKKQETSSKDQALLTALSPVVNKLIDLNYQNSKDKIASQMAPLLGSAIREQIKSQKDDVVDALYPVLGNMISKYVSQSFQEMLNSINDQIQDGLSFHTFKRKVKAKMRGVSETQLLLEENSASDIRALLLIHKETGIVLAEVYDPEKPLSEPEMVASMMTAIRSFVNDWVEKNEVHSEIGEINYGGSKIIIEDGGYSYLAVIVDGPTYSKTYKKIRTTLEQIIIDHGEDIRNFNGNLNDFSNMSIYHEIALLLENKEPLQNRKKKLHPLLFLLPLLLVSFGTWHWYINNLDTALNQKIKTTLYKTTQLTSFRIDSFVEDGSVTLRGEVPFKYHKSLAVNVLKDISSIKKIHNEIKIVNALHDPMQISSNISYLISGINLDDGINITYIYTYPSVKITGNTWDNKRKNKVINTFNKIKTIENISFDIKIMPPKKELKFYYEHSSFLLSKTQTLQLLEFSKLLNILDTKTIISIKGYSDNLGSHNAKQKVALKRAQSVASVLEEKFSVKQKMIISGEKQLPHGIDVENHPNKARFTSITLEYGDE